MTASEFVSEIRRRSKVLAITGWVHLVLFAGFVLAMPFDSRLVRGINPWIKPAKFAISITIYVWTVAWLLGYLQDRIRLRRITGWGIAISMYAEIAGIALQAGRGTTSHFNVATPLDGAIFSLMGLMIALNTVMNILLLVAFFQGHIYLDPSSLWGIRLGLAIFLVGAAVGGVMIAHNSHAVGVEEGGAGLPFINWSTEGGDLRAAHFLGIHALQILPIAGFLLRRRKAAVFVVAIVYAGAVGFLYLEALRGSPLLRM